MGLDAFNIKHAMMQITQSLLLAAAVVLVGCAHNANVRTTGTIERSQLQGRSFAIQGQSAAVSRISDSLKAAGMKQGSAGQAEYIVTVSHEDRPKVQRAHTGGKNGLSYDRTVRESVLVLSVARSSAPGTPVFTATAEGGDVESLSAAAVAAIRG